MEEKETVKSIPIPSNKMDQRLAFGSSWFNFTGIILQRLRGRAKFQVVAETNRHTLLHRAQQQIKQQQQTSCHRHRQIGQSRTQLQRINTQTTPWRVTIRDLSLLVYNNLRQREVTKMLQNNSISKERKHT